MIQKWMLDFKDARFQNFHNEPNIERSRKKKVLDPYPPPPHTQLCMHMHTHYVIFFTDISALI